MISPAAAVWRSSRAWRFRSSFGGSREVQMDSAKNLFTLVPLILQGRPEEKTALLLGNKDIELTENTISPQIFGIPNEVRYCIANQHAFPASLYSQGCVKHLQPHKSSVTQRAFALHLPMRTFAQQRLNQGLHRLGRLSKWNEALQLQTLVKDWEWPGWRDAAHGLDDLKVFVGWPKISQAQWNGCP